MEKVKQAGGGAGSVKKIVGLALAVVFFVAGAIAPESQGLTQQGAMAVGILFACIALWIGETLPVGITAVLGALLLFLSGVRPTMGEAFSGFTSTSFWFMFAVFSLTAVMVKTTIGNRLVNALVKKAGTKPKNIVLAYMVATAIISTVMTNSGAAAIGLALAIPFLKSINAKESKRNLGRCIMLGVAMSVVLGGFVTPFGHALNVLCAGLVESTYGITIGFVDWVVPGVLVCAILLPVFWYVLCKVFPPEELSESETAYLTKDYGAWTTLDKKSLVYIVAVIALFVVGNWVPVLSSTTVMLVALVLMFLPGIGVINWKDFQEAQGWNVTIMVGGIMCLGDGITSSGASDWIVNLFLSTGILGMSPFVALLLATAAIYIIQTVAPVAPALITLFVPPLAAFCVAAGVSPAVFAMLMASCSASSFLLPFSPSTLLTYNEGYYTIGEMAKPGAVISIAFVVVVYFVGGLLLPAV